MKGKNLCTVLHGKNDIRMEEREIPTPKPNQVLVRINTVGICGTDVHYWQHATLGPYTLKKPMVLGHESSGIVAGLGSEVKGFKIGE
uniref:Sorbitol dehydrogenase n=2 Tax=Ascaris lumbricoides TaxID=6252 RepID=A0A0M3HG77_ASCLU